MAVLMTAVQGYVISHGSNLTLFCQSVQIDFLCGHFQESILLLSLSCLKQQSVSMILIFFLSEDEILLIILKRHLNRDEKSNHTFTPNGKYPSSIIGKILTYW